MTDDEPRCCAASRQDADTGDPAHSQVAPARHLNGGGMAAEPRALAPARTAPDTRDMVQLEGGTFLMGSEDGEGFPADGEGPIRQVTVAPFLIDTTAVSNKEFQAFVAATGYSTEAEDYGWSFVYAGFLSQRVAGGVTQKVQDAPWWWKVDGASWLQPEGPGSDLAGRLDHPVVHVSWNDAAAYARWAAKRLPTEAEWEFAARGGLEQKRFPWGDELTPGGDHRCNIWQGDFPRMNTCEDGYGSTAPVTAFPANGYGLFNVSGNVWEWCSDWFSAAFHVHGPREHPTGPPKGSRKVMRGGSYMCHHSYCNRYRVGARSANTPDSSTGNMGFRCAAAVTS